jgi:hypothetical protein
MSCPYLTEVTMAFCRAYPVKKLVPSERVVTESRCDSESFEDCPVFREVLVRMAREARDLKEASHAQEPPCPAPKAGGS